MNDRLDVEHALRASAAAPTPLPDRAFVDGLERRLGGGPLSGNVLPFARKARRFSAGVVVAGSLTFAGVAAAAGIAVTHPFQHDAAPVATAPATTITEPPSTVAATEPATVPRTVPPTVPGTAATPAPVTVPHVEPTTTAPRNEPAPTTEVKVPATMTLSCAPAAGSVQCTWSAGPVGTGHYDVLRSDGRAFQVEGTTTWTDPLPLPGSTVSYLVHAMSSFPNPVSLGHTDRVSVTCC
jgi:hypothetical protein